MSTLITAFITGIFAMIGWGTSDFFAKKSIDRIGVLATLAFSQLFGALVLIALFLLSGTKVPSFNSWHVLLLTAIVILYIGIYLYHYTAYKKGPVSTNSPIIASGGGLALVVAMIFFQRVPSMFNSVGLTLVILGLGASALAIITRKKSLHKSGFIEALLAALLISMWFPLWNRFAHGPDWLWSLIELRLSVGVILTLMYMFLSFNKKHSQNKPIKITDVKNISMVVILDVIAYFAVSSAYDMGREVSYITNGITSLSFLPTVILGLIVLKEKMNMLQILGFIMLLAGMFMASI